MKLVAVFHNELEASLARDRLTSVGIMAHVIGAKEYTSHVLGGGEGRYELLVPAEDFDRATQSLNGLVPAFPPSIKPEPPLIPDYFRRAVFYGLAGLIVLPGVFNVVSLINAELYWRHSAKDSAALRKLLFIAFCQVPGIIGGLLYFKFLFD